jgi:hypothetical protein
MAEAEAVGQVLPVRTEHHQQVEMAEMGRHRLLPDLALLMQVVVVVAITTQARVLAAAAAAAAVEMAPLDSFKQDKEPQIQVAAQAALEILQHRVLMADLVL